MSVVFSIIESPLHPNLTALYRRRGFSEVKLTSVRKAIQALKQQVPDIVVADFVYGFGNNYAGVNVSNLDVFLYSLQKYRRDSRLILFVDKSEQQYIHKLEEIFPVHGILTYPVQAEDVEALLAD